MDEIFGGGRNGFKVRFFKNMRLELIKKKDPVVRYKINGVMLKMPMSQMTPKFMKENPNYDRQLPKICEQIKEKVGRNLSIIDVGANIGDTVINIGMKDAKYLLVEGCSKYYELISDNLQNNYNYKLEKCFLGDAGSATGTYKIITDHGTACLSPVTDTNENSSITITLDDLLRKYPFAPDILKIDTDGFDFAVMRGAEDTLRTHKPYIYFEWGIEDLIKNNEDPVSIWNYLNNLGYKKAYIYDNFGSLLTVISTDDYEALKLLSNYIINAKPRKIWYYDVLLINECKKNIILY